MQKFFCSLSFGLATIVWQALPLPVIAAENPIRVCASDDNPPFSSESLSEKSVDIQVVRLLASKLNRRVEIRWITIPNRGGLGKALRTSIVEGHCDVFTGLPSDSAFIQELKEKKLMISRPYLRTGYFALYRQGLPERTGYFDEKIRIGTLTRSSGDFYIHRKYPDNRYPFNGTDELIEALGRGEIDSALVWAPSLAGFTEKISQQKIQLSEFETDEPALKMRLGMATRQVDIALMDEINISITELVADGSLTRLLQQTPFSFAKLP